MWGSETGFVVPNKHTTTMVATATARSAAEVDGTDTSLREEPDQKYQPNTFMLDKDKKKGKSDDPGFAIIVFPLTVWLIIFVVLFIINSQNPAPAPPMPPPPTMPGA